ncbi:MAG TPA: hypothetical protein VK973_13385 [Arenicellales bacterium]|nr:hypothetical protein [Arenicellales bacterium]
MTGALAAIDALRETLELRRDEARDECVHEVLDNVVALVQAHEIEYRRRKEVLQASPGPHENL